MIKRGRKVDEWVVNGIGYENLCLLCIDGNAFCIVWILKKLGVTIQKKELLLINILTIFVVFTEFFIISSIRDLDFSLDYGRVKVITLITILLAIVGRGCFPYWEEDSDKSANNSSDLSESKNKKPKLN
ncbi:hypothetical protein, partial [Stenoxybacter acetivorans]|uniref:hypothetical protein n=1 Tax=Stenoxybacter acetivorans TaxID=422441 RepID=UPI00056A3FD0